MILFFIAFNTEIESSSNCETISGVILLFNGLRYCCNVGTLMETLISPIHPKFLCRHFHFHRLILKFRHCFKLLFWCRMYDTDTGLWDIVYYVKKFRCFKKDLDPIPLFVCTSLLPYGLTEKKERRKIVRLDYLIPIQGLIID